MIARVIIVALLVPIWPQSGATQDTFVMPEPTLVMDDGWELVFAHCSACHSLRLVTSNRGDRATWLRLIRWMQDTQNLWEIDPSVETQIVDYLARNYPPQDAVRRAQLPAELLPPAH